MTNFVSNKR